MHAARRLFLLAGAIFPRRGVVAAVIPSAAVWRVASRRFLPDTTPHLNSRRTALAWLRSTTSSNRPGSRSPAALSCFHRRRARSPAADNLLLVPPARHSRLSGNQTLPGILKRACRAHTVPSGRFFGFGARGSTSMKTPDFARQIASASLVVRTRAPASVAGTARDNSPCDRRQVRERHPARSPAHSIGPSARTPRGAGRRASTSWRLRRGLHADRLIFLVEQRYAEVEQDLVDRGLVLLDQPVELPLPVLVGGADAHPDAKDQLGSGGLLDQRRDMQWRIGMLGVKAAIGPQRMPASIAPDSRSLTMASTDESMRVSIISG